MADFWVGTASREHVQAAVTGGFCQLSHGKEVPVRRLTRGDIIIFYSSRERMGAGEQVKAFTAAGRVIDDLPFQVEQGGDFHPYRRRVRYFATNDAPILPLLDELSFTKGKSDWGMAFRRGTLRVTANDYKQIASAMGVREQDVLE